MDCSPPGSSAHGDSQSKNTRMGSHSLLQGIFPTQGSNPGPRHCRQLLQCLSHQGRCIYRVRSLAQEHLLQYSLASLLAQSVKNLPVMLETWVQSLSWEDPREKGMATYSSSCLENPMDGEGWQATVYGFQRVGQTIEQVTHTETP